MSGNHVSNRDKALAAWVPDTPAWVLLLADACDRTNQRVIADRLGKSGGYVSRLVNRSYAGSYPEAEQLVRATLGAEEVMCPLFGRMPLKTCIRSPFDQSGRFAIGLEGEGADRRLVILVRHADGTGLAVSLSDLGMGRFGDLVTDAYRPAGIAAAAGRVR